MWEHTLESDTECGNYTRRDQEMWEHTWKGKGNIGTHLEGKAWVLHSVIRRGSGPAWTQ